VCNSRLATLFINDIQVRDQTEVKDGVLFVNRQELEELLAA